VAAVRKALFASLILLIASAVSFSQELYIANESQSKLELLNLSSGALSTLYLIGAKPDDLTLNSQGQLIYSIPSLGEVDLYDPATGINSVLFSGVKYARDVAIEPGGASMLVAIYTPGKIVRYNFSTKAQTTLTTGLHTCDGIAYDKYGNLYAVAYHNTIVRIDPVTGAVLQTLVLEPHSGVNGGDGMTYDPYTGQLWITHDGTTGYGLEEIFTNASGFTGAFTLYLTPGYRALDGIKSDGKGNLYIGDIHLALIYNIPAMMVTKSFVVDGADGVALVPGTY
jgi:hypothetical protein